MTSESIFKLFCVVALVAGQPLPGFSTYRADPKSSGVMLESGTTMGLEKWQFKTNISTGDMIANSAVIGPDEDLFFTISDVLFCVTKFGVEKFRYRSRGLFFASTATVTKDSLYIIGSNFQWGDTISNAILMSFSLSGKLLWSYKFKYLPEPASVKVMNDGTILAVLNEFHLYAFSPSGAMLWEFNELGDFNENAAISENTPAILQDNSIVYVCKDGMIRSLSPDGNLQWALQITPYYYLRSPSVGEDGNIYLSVDEGTGYVYNASVYCISSKGTVIWKYSAQSEVREITSAIYYNGNVYVVMDSYLYSIREGELKWKYYFYDKLYGALTVWNTPLITSENNMLYIGAFFYVYGFSIANTEFSTEAPTYTWRYTTTTYATSTTGMGPIPTIDTDGNLYVGAYNKLYALGNK